MDGGSIFLAVIVVFLAVSIIAANKKNKKNDKSEQ